MSHAMRVMSDESESAAPVRATPVKPVITYPRDATLSAAQVAAALGVSSVTVERQGWPSFKVGGSRRYLWGQLLDHWAKEATRNQ